MFNKKLFLIAMILLLFTSMLYAVDLPDSLFAWGAYANFIDNTVKRDSLREVLGFNVINNIWDRSSGQIEAWRADEIYVYPNRGALVGGVDHFKYAEAYYTLLQTEDTSSVLDYHFRGLSGGPSGDFWVYDSADISDSRTLL